MTNMLEHKIVGIVLAPSRWAISQEHTHTHTHLSASCRHLDTHTHTHAGSICIGVQIVYTQSTYVYWFLRWLIPAVGGWVARGSIIALTPHLSPSSLPIWPAVQAQSHTSLIANWAYGWANVCVEQMTEWRLVEGEVSEPPCPCFNYGQTYWSQCRHIIENTSIRLKSLQAENRMI